MVHQSPQASSLAQQLASWASFGMSILLVVAFVWNLTVAQKQDSVDAVTLKAEVSSLQTKLDVLSSDVAKMSGKMDMMILEHQNDRRIPPQQ